MNYQNYLPYLALLMLLSTPVFADNWQGRTPEKHTALLEMFVSEGCGLCPAAEHFVHQTLPEQGILDEDLIVLTFHVDYLNDRKGWIDKFAQPEFTSRQKQLAHLNHYQHIFTPELVASGETIHSWREQLIDVIALLNNYPAEADIQITAKRTDATLSVQTAVQVRGDENRAHSKLYLAVTENHVRNEVHGGDNAGTVFNHQDLVRKWLGPFSLSNRGESVLMTEIPLAEEWQSDALSLVAVVQNLSDGYVLQALHVPLD
ncbi:uncharacterized secreted protein [Methylophaga frappieri]|uniref:Uncharacterized secreted protein n=1 Tax=Methylophaga frappieri (strain ATCC BAA-2434 / DSM 25690 / JAM7) TaxID=754477 RepID=I1YEX0_METFJ|nr:DUF1223 domain-containing protein [Methylophaga frappieri]AFJ01463.1 uncharacterized secreted protein [Methylophaga frappieri]